MINHIIFALDLGNSRLKIGLYIFNQPIDSIENLREIQPNYVAYLGYDNNRLDQKELNKLHEFYQKEVIAFKNPNLKVEAIGCCVAGTDRQNYAEDILIKYFKINFIKWFTASEEAFGLKNLYENPTQLGVDRWVSMIYGYLTYSMQSILIINAGTAVTVDMVSRDGEFVGGVILAGMKLMEHALFTKTAEIKTKFDQQFHQFSYYPRNTGDAVFSGILFSLVGGVEKLRFQLMTHDNLKEINEITCIFSGGDGEYLKSLTNGVTKFEPYLVLNGLVSILITETKNKSF